MARQIITKLVDDLTGEQADETVSFALDGSSYNIDLSGKNALEFRKALAPYIEAGQRIGRVASSSGPNRLPGSRKSLGLGSSAREESTAIRTWAAENNLVVAERGRIPQHIVDAYNARNNANSVLKAVKESSRAREVTFKAELRPRRRSSDSVSA